ncbi:A4 [Alcelaphine gammaherpesvirus 2]|uniref:A4 n=1 Tax=Alcelaphine gammaherpesvirus 2 TaxID=138184 RepID=A0A068A9W4_9GAMA|nr:A4 [Alcelaphine gammaherpesvirus 2]AIA62044.1 A4 [Alcelaphine gammaherpesvirus 2]
MAALHHQLAVLIAALYFIFFVNAAPTVYEEEEDFNSTEYDVFLEADSFPFSRNSSGNCTISLEEATQNFLKALEKALKIIAGHLNDTEETEIPTYPPTMTTPVETTPMETGPLQTSPPSPTHTKV